MADLKTILERIEFKDDAKVVAQLTDQHKRVSDRLSSIKHKILVMSGKGGVGKSTTTAQLALAFARRGLKVGVLDADINGPSIPHILGLSDSRWRPTGADADPVVGPEGIKVASMAFFLDGGEPVRWDGPTHLSHVWLGLLEAGTLREFLGDVNWGELDLLLIDMPPGAAADKPPAVLQFIQDVDGAVFVRTPSKMARSVIDRSIRYAGDLGLEVLGVIENMAGAFGDVEVEEGLLGQISFDSDLAASLDRGEPLPASHEISRAFGSIAAVLEEKIR